MKILGVVGSRRKNGNTSRVINAMFNNFSSDIEREIVYLGDYNFSSCIGCEGCSKTFKCILKDDMQEIYPKILESDGIVLGSPTYFYNITSEMKALIDRLYCYELFDDDVRAVWMGLNEVTGIKYAATVAVCEQNNAEDMGFTSDAMNLPLEALGYRVVSKVKILNAFKAGDVNKIEGAIKEAESAAVKLEKTLKLRQKISNEISISVREMEEK